MPLAGSRSVKQVRGYDGIDDAHDDEGLGHRRPHDAQDDDGEAGDSCQQANNGRDDSSLHNL